MRQQNDILALDLEPLPTMCFGNLALKSIHSACAAQRTSKNGKDQGGWRSVLPRKQHHNDGAKAGR